MNVVRDSMTEYLFSLYGTSLGYVTESSLLAAPVNELLRHFRRDSIEESAALTLYFRPVQNRAAIPLTMSSSARQLSSGTGVAVESRQETGLPYEVIQGEGRLIADFHNTGVLVMDGVQGRADGYLIKPETVHANLIEWGYPFNRTASRFFATGGWQAGAEGLADGHVCAGEPAVRHGGGGWQGGPHTAREHGRRPAPALDRTPCRDYGRCAG